MRKKTFSLAALNIVMPVPHNRDRYISLFKKAFQSKARIKIRGDYYGLIGTYNEETLNGDPIISGVIYKFMNLNTKDDWFNTSENRPALEDDLNEVNVPDHLKPHLRIFEYIFIPSQHYLLFVSQYANARFSPNMAQNFFTKLFSSIDIINTYGEINVITFPKSEELERILNLKKLKSLFLEVIPPNSDDFGGMDSQIMNDLNEVNAKRLTQDYEGKEDGLRLNEKFKNLAKVASHNGKVIGHGINELNKSETVDDDIGHHLSLKHSLLFIHTQIPIDLHEFIDGSFELGCFGEKHISSKVWELIEK